jgi:hypothetical protein
LVPGSYLYDVTGDGSSAGDSVQETTGTVTVPRDPAIDDADNARTFSTTIIASGARTSVSGQVVGPSGPNPGVPLAGVTVAMQHFVGGSWVAADDVNGNLLQTTTAADGTYRFIGVPHDPAYQVTFADTGYLNATSAQFQVAVGDTLFLGAQPMIRVTHDVTIKLTIPTGDNISGATAATLTSQDFAGYTLDAGMPNVSDSVVSWKASQVPFGCWTFTVTLPGGHYGTISQTTGSGSCSTGFEVPSTGSQPVESDFQLSEYQPQVQVTLTAIDGDTAPSTVTITASTGSGNPDYVDHAFPVSATAAALPIWVTGTQTVSLSVDRDGWPGDQATISSDAPIAALTSTEQGVSVSVQVTVNGAALSGSQKAVVQLLPPSGISYSTKLDANAANGTVTFTGVPAVAGWQAKATLVGPSVTSSPSGVSALFDVTATTPTQTVDITSP